MVGGGDRAGGCCSSGAGSFGGWAWGLVEAEGGLSAVGKLAHVVVIVGGGGWAGWEEG